MRMKQESRIKNPLMQENSLNEQEKQDEIYRNITNTCTSRLLLAAVVVVVVVVAVAVVDLQLEIC